MVYRYNIRVEESGTIDTTRQLSREELEEAVSKVLNIPKWKMQSLRIVFEGDVTGWGNAKYGPNWTPDTPVMEIK